MAAQPTTHEVAVAPVEGVILDRPQTDIRIPADEVDETRWDFCVSREAWYAPSLGERDDEIMVQRASAGGGCFWEFGIRQVSNIGVRAEVFDDAWAAFAERPDLFATLARLGKGATLDDVREILTDLGFADATERETPPQYRRDAATQAESGGSI